MRVVRRRAVGHAGIAIAILALATTLAAATAQGPLAQPQIDLKGRLYRAVFVAGPGTLSSGDIAAVPPALRARLSRFLTRRAAFTSSYESAPTDIAGMKRDARRRELERAVVSLIEIDGIAPRAAAFVKDLPVADEWEGVADRPLAESAFAEQLLQQEPSTPLAPFLYLFIAQRQRAASEAAEASQNPAVATAASAKAGVYLQKARAVADPIFGLIADDLQRLPYVHLRKKEAAL